MACFSVLPFTSLSDASIYQQSHSQISSGSGAISGDVYRMRSMTVGSVATSSQMTGELYAGWISTGYVIANAANNAPHLNIDAGFRLADIREDPDVNSGTTIHAIIDSVAAPVTDIDRDARQGIAVTGVSNMNGQWQYTIDDGETWHDLLSLSDTDSLLLAADDPDTRIRFSPSQDYFGTQTGELTFRAWDQSMGENGSAGVDVSENGGQSAFSLVQGSIGIEVSSVNDIPTTDGIDNIDVDEDSIDTAIPLVDLFADIEDDTLTYTIQSNSNIPLFSATDIDSGILTLDYAPDANGNADITIRATDSDDEFVEAAFLVSVSPMPDAPIVKLPIGDREATEDKPYYLNISGYFGDADDDRLTFSASGLPGTLALNGISGEIEGIPTNEDALNSPYAITVTATDTTFLSETAGFELAVAGVNDAPAAVADNYGTPEDTELKILSPGVLDNDSDIDSTAITAILDASPKNGSLNLGSDGSFRYNPNPDFNGTDGFTYHANDGTADSAIVTVVLTIDSVNDLPIAHAGSDQTVDEGEPVQLDGSASDDPDDGIDAFAWNQTDGPKTTLSGPSSSQPSFSAPDVGPNGGVLVFELTVKDKSGAISKDTVAVNVNALDQQPFLMIADYQPSTYTMPGETFKLSLTAEGEEIGCTDLTFALLSDSNPPQNMRIERDGCHGEILWPSDDSDVGDIYSDLQAIVRNAGQDSEPVTFSIEVLEPLAIDPNTLVIMRTVHDDVPDVITEEFTITGGKPHSSIEYYEYDLIYNDKPFCSDESSSCEKKITGDPSGSFKLAFPTSGRDEGAYKLRITDGEGFTKISGLIEIRDIVILPVEQQVTAETDGTVVNTITEGDYAGTSIAVPRCIRCGV